MPKDPLKTSTKDAESSMGCASRAAMFFVGAAGVLMGLVTVVMPQEQFGSGRKRYLIGELLFCTRPGGVVVILIGCCVLAVALRRK